MKPRKPKSRIFVPLNTKVNIPVGANVNGVEFDWVIVALGQGHIQSISDLSNDMSDARFLNDATYTVLIETSQNANSYDITITQVGNEQMYTQSLNMELYIFHKTTKKIITKSIMVLN